MGKDRAKIVSVFSIDHRIFILSGILLLTACGQAEDSNAVWAEFRGSGQSFAKDAGLPVEWSDSKNILWKKALAGEGQSSPVIANQSVYVSSTGGDQKEHLYLEAFALDDGALQWKAEFAATQKPEKVTDMISRGAPTPVVDSHGVYVFFESGDLFGLDLEGNTVWERRLATEFGEYVGGHGIGTSLVNTPDHIILSIDHDGPSYLLCVKKSDGSTVWKTERSSRVSWTTPVYRNGEIFVSSNGSVDCYDSATGKQIWTVTGIKGNTVASPTLQDDLVVVGSSNPGDCMAIKAGGSGDVTDTNIVWRAAGVTSSFGSPLIHKNLVFFVNRAGVIQAVHLADGTLAWQHRLPSSTWASPLTVGDSVYFFCKDGQTAILSPTVDGPGELVVNELAVGEGDRIYGYAVAPEIFIFRTAREVLCIKD
ncbi:MAG: PQQ-binding-like beta-propeller repeat protein [Verrucomicrobiales bacterium]|nr:PQQ-binding-like beta-propeller repeat protein [Verrucomicrobiales bacterium]